MVLLSGQINPGNGTGTLKTGAETWSAGAGLTFQINNATGTAGTNWSQLTINGNLNLSALAANAFHISLVGLDSSNEAGSVLNFNDAQSYTWQLASFTSQTGAFNSADFSIDDSGFSDNNVLNGGAFSLSDTGSALDLVYTPNIAPIPEPSISSLIMLAFGMIILVWRRCRTRLRNR